MKILYAAMKYDYGRPEHGLSFEHYNFYDALLSMGHDIIYFDFMTLLQKRGRHRMNQLLRDIVRSEKPSLLFSCLFEDEFDYQTFRHISSEGDTVTLNWFTDDHWRFEGFSRPWAQCFNWVVTTSNGALRRYHEKGHVNVIKSQWACNHFLYRPLQLPPRYDVTFVGQPHGDRPAIIKALGKRGIAVRTWGAGWGSGRVSQDEMIRIFSESRINLNLSNASTAVGKESRPLEHLVRKALKTIPMGDKLKGFGKKTLSVLKSGASPVCHPDQIKGRNFEVPGCGGFLLTGLAEDIGDYYEQGEEIETFGTVEDLGDKIEYFLSNESQRDRIAHMGYERTIREHTYVHRFTEIFREIELPVEPLQADLPPEARPGRTEEVL